MKGVIIILGSPNDSEGRLLSIAKERLDLGFEEYKKTGYKILLTGGFGEHFNHTKKPHAFYAKNYLLEKGVKDRDILEFAESSNTVEDAEMSKAILDEYEVEEVILVTSDFHLERVRYIFDKILEGYKLSYLGSETHKSEEELEVLREHERKALELSID